MQVLRQTWPLAQTPLPDELLSSWILRNAYAHGLTPHALATGVWGTGALIFTRDVDRAAPAVIVETMAQYTETDSVRAAATGLPAYVGSLVLDLPAKGTVHWVMPMGLRDRDRRGFGLQFCPSCLAADEKPYLRRGWRLAVSTVCSVHGTELLDACPACANAVVPRRSVRLHLCWSCGFDLRRAPAKPGGDLLLSFQRRAEAALACGWATLGETMFNYSHLYFALARQVAKTLATGPRSAKLRRVVASVWGGDADLPRGRNNRRDVELLPARDRRVLLDLVERVLADWPARFVGACAEAGVWHSWALADAIDPPHAYLHAVQTYLERHAYSPNVAEVAAAVAHLLRAHPNPSREALKRLLGHTSLGHAHLSPLPIDKRQ